MSEILRSTPENHGKTRQPTPIIIFDGVIPTRREPHRYEGKGIPYDQYPDNSKTIIPTGTPPTTHREFPPSIGGKGLLL